ncbi:MAG: spore coat associated protein CotJA [Chloroflexi bacterium]|nr:spore coat associated protein CotJA [Chloroflexota bacterium]
MNDRPANPLGTGHLARAFVCPQEYTTRFNPIEGLMHGTIFPELVSPYPGCWHQTGICPQGVPSE